MDMDFELQAMCLRINVHSNAMTLSDQVLTLTLIRQLHFKRCILVGLTDASVVI